MSTPDGLTEEERQAHHDRVLEIRVLTQTARAIVEISPEAARAVRDAARKLQTQHLKEMRKVYGAK